MPEQPPTSPEHTGSDDDRRLLARISDEMVRAKKEFFGRGPTKAKSYVLDDMLVVVMRGGMTTAEKTMLDFGHRDQVRQFRQLFENAMAERLTKTMEKLTGQRIVNYQSQILFNPDIVVELFVFDTNIEEEGGLAEGAPDDQLLDADSAPTTNDRPLDQPPSYGR